MYQHVLSPRASKLSRRTGKCETQRRSQDSNEGTTHIEYDGDYASERVQCSAGTGCAPRARDASTAVSAFRTQPVNTIQSIQPESYA